ncbi:MAG: class I SAM-dependent methyltransferase [Flavobacteriaceae bacterium]|nr:class I SAM-dependent methyltransferase [Flavobacteriaceae bacterium]
MSLKSLVAKILGKKNSKRVKKLLGYNQGNAAQKKFPGSEKYWDQRYKKNKNSGAGSYGRLAEFKAEIINEFVQKNRIETIIEYGSGDGNQLKLANYPNYVGFDVSDTALELCRQEFEGDTTKNFFHMEDPEQITRRAQLTMSLDVLYHLVEDEVFNGYMTRLFNSSDRFVMIYSSNYEKEMADHVRSRKFTDWVDSNMNGSWKLKEFIKNKFPFSEDQPDTTSISDFYIYEKQ